MRGGGSEKYMCICGRKKETFKNWERVWENRTGEQSVKWRDGN